MSVWQYENRKILVYHLLVSFANKSFNSKMKLTIYLNRGWHIRLSEVFYNYFFYRDEMNEGPGEAGVAYHLPASRDNEVDVSVSKYGK